MPTVIIPSLVALYKCNETSGLVVVDSINGYNGVPSVDLSLMTAAGKVSNGFQFSNSNNRKIAIADVADLRFTGNASIFWWFNHTASLGSAVPLFEKMNWTNGWLIWNSHNAVWFDLFSLGASYDASWSFGSTKDNWTFYSVTWNATTKKANLYINCVQQAEKTSTIGIGDNTGINMTFGASAQGGGNAPTGIADIAGFCNDILTTEQMAALYNGGPGNEDIFKTLSIVSIAVTPINPSKAKGLTQQFTATATWNDGSETDVTATASWVSSDETKSIVAAGLASCFAEGDSSITASQGGITSPAQVLTVTAPEIISIAITPTNPTKIKGQKQQFTATATLTDITTTNITSTATWASSNEAKATETATAGEFEAIGVGTANITAEKDGITSPAQIITITNDLVSIVVTPAGAKINKNKTQQYVSIGTYQDETQGDITSSSNWASSDELIATIGLNTGLATGLKAGTTEITATKNAIVSPSQTLTVKNPAVPPGCLPFGFMVFGLKNGFRRY